MIKTINKGFTLIEMLVVIAIIAILGAVAAPGIMSKINDARAAQLISNVDTLTVAVAAEISSQLDSDYRQIANLDTLKASKRIKSQVKTTGTFTYLPGPWNSQLAVAADTLSEGAAYYVVLTGVKTKEACSAITSFLSKKSLAWDVVTTSGTTVDSLLTVGTVGTPAVATVELTTGLSLPANPTDPTFVGAAALDCKSSTSITGSTVMSFTAMFE